MIAEMIVTLPIVTPNIRHPATSTSRVGKQAIVTNTVAAIARTAAESAR